MLRCPLLKKRGAPVRKKVTIFSHTRNCIPDCCNRPTLARRIGVFIAINASEFPAGGSLFYVQRIIWNKLLRNARAWCNEVEDWKELTDDDIWDVMTSEASSAMK